MADKADYDELIRFLMTPFLDSPEDLKTDFEELSSHNKVWLRVAFSSEDRGRMFGRGGRNIQAIRTILQATAALYDQRFSLDVYGESSGQGRSAPDSNSSEGGGGYRRRRNGGGKRPSRRH
ncbi:MAG: KH domain-containing protein [Leptolyngbya sp. SIO1D8]|nr:KH domain-containing protein [Leptolyngbya sp. SIO1D8]